MAKATPQFVEDMARVFERFGLPRMASRVWALLWVSGAPQLSAGEIAEELNASAGSVSTATRQLLDLDLIDRVRVVNERRSYFRTDTHALERLLLRRTAGAAEMVRLADTGLRRFGDEPVTRARLENMRHFYAWFLEEMEDLAQRWREEADSNLRHE
ncbi:MAG: GbsR/MarR family transcriptional regulator [Acidimicrobiia bacterium]